MPAYSVIGCSNCQFLKGTFGFWIGNNNRLYLKNTLIANITYGLFDWSSSYGDNFVTAEHVTFDQVSCLASRYYGSPGMMLNMNVTNCVLASIAQLSLDWSAPIVWNGDYNGFYNSPTFGAHQIPAQSAPFQTVGAGSHYLAGTSGFRNAGPTGISADLLAEIRKKTTTASTEILNNFTTDRTLGSAQEPLVPRDTGQLLDLGYHYDPLDYVMNGKTVSARLALTSGVTLGTYGASSSYGISIVSGGSLISEASPTALNRIVRYNTVQEQSSGPWSSSTVGPSVKRSSSAATVDIRFTGWSLLAGVGDHFYDSAGGSTPTAFSDSQFGGGRFTVYASPTALKNCLWERVAVAIDDDHDLVTFSAFNNLLRGGSLLLTLDKQENNWVLKDNAFDDVAITTQGNGAITHDYNCYVLNKPRLGPPAANDVVVSSMVYAVGPLGVRYQGNTALIDKGSRSAFAAGLFHHTVKATGPKEGAEPPGTGEPPEKVDIGFHYVAVNGSGQPLDTDGDSTPDYLDADSDGNGMSDDAEIQYFGLLGSLQAHVIGQLTQRTNGRDPNVAQTISYGVAPAGPPWPPNPWPPNHSLSPNCWLAGATGLTSFSPFHDYDWNTYPNAEGGCLWYQGGPTLITPRHAITVEHRSSCFFQVANEVVRFLDVNGNPHDVHCLRKETTIFGNICVLVFDQDLPSTVQWVKVLPTTVIQKLSPAVGQLSNLAGRLPCIGCNQVKRAHITDVYFFGFGDPRQALTRPSLWFPTWGTRFQPDPCDQVYGDSGSPAYLLINNELVLIGAWETSCDSSWVGPYIGEVNGVISNLDTWVSQNCPQVPNPITGHTVTVANLDAFPNLQ